MVEMRNVCRLFVGEPDGRDRQEDLDIGRWIILGRILEMWDMVKTGLVWLRIRTSGELLCIRY
jgi:hypothetical protein